MKPLSIVITTYNRKNSLLKQLKAIEKLNGIENYDLIISDNHSNYDIDQLLRENFNSSFYSNIKLYIKPYNTEAVGNMSQAFLLPKTKWMWLLSDDDLVTSDSLSIILNDIHNNKDIGVFKYALDDNGKNYYENNNIETIDQLIMYYKQRNHTSGHLLFMSNNVYNMDLIAPYIGEIFKYSYTNMCHIIPLLFGLYHKTIKMYISNKIIVTYIFPTWENHWSYTAIALGLSTISDTHIFKKKQLKEFKKILASMFIPIRFYKSCVSLEPRFLRIMVYKRVFFSLFYYKYSITDWLYFILFIVQYFSRIDFIKIFQNIKKIKLWLH